MSVNWDRRMLRNVALFVTVAKPWVDAQLAVLGRTRLATDRKGYHLPQEEGCSLLGCPCRRLFEA